MHRLTCIHIGCLWIVFLHYCHSYYYFHLYRFFKYYKVVEKTLLWLSSNFLLTPKNRELSLRKGDTVYLLRRVDKNWYEGEHHSTIGIFPVSYVEVCHVVMYAFKCISINLFCWNM
ncbi:hypothetical protein HELRODRAFT_93088 [Helobdella robusta]|uniref:SH3 domain-containing protein n=1 Tax=Helobdella robusta TaxID=6412 RepID=T1G8T1_HELRO|nr:hypothetical protein HELRODRAFT_93088 [Helobdella robusta]ESN98206.1 hypothetical protein HELRODRAFT_93088 [Helobdella robusta]